MKIYFVSWITDNKVSPILTRRNANNRLLSYYFLKIQLPKLNAKSKLREYVRTGKIKTLNSIENEN
jgi:hypothetical protein